MMNIDSNKISENTQMSYDNRTDAKVMNALDYAYNNKIRVRFWYGDSDTGTSWNDEYDTIGYISRSCGAKVPILIANNRSNGGGAILTHRIVKIVEVKTKRVLYKHELFNQTNFTVKDNIVYQAENDVYGRCKTNAQAIRLADFMNGKRMCK